MTLIKVSKLYKDFITERPDHQKTERELSRRKFITTSAYAGAAGLILPKLLMGSLVKSAFADTTMSACPSTAGIKGGLMQIHCDGGCTSSQYFLTDRQEGLLGTTSGATIASNYGLSLATGSTANLMALGNGYIDKGTIFGATLATAPAGISQTTWTAILKNCSVTGIFGATSADDGAGQQLGFVNPQSYARSAPLGAMANNSVASTSWASQGAVTTYSSSPTPTNVAALYGVVPPTLTSTALVNDAQTAALALNNLFSPMLGTASRKGASQLGSAINCGMASTATTANPQYGTNLFTPGNIASITASGITLSSLSPALQVMLAAYYQNAMGLVASVSAVQGGADYHGQSATDIGTFDQLVAQSMQMFLLANFIAGTPGVAQITSNGYAIAAGSTSTTLNGITGTAANAQGDAGGFFSAAWSLYYNPSGSLPSLTDIGTFNTSTGAAIANPNLTTVPEAMGSMALSALSYLGVNTASALAILEANGFPSTTPLNFTS